MMRKIIKFDKLKNETEKINQDSRGTFNFNINNFLKHEGSNFFKTLSDDSKKSSINEGLRNEFTGNFYSGFEFQNTSINKCGFRKRNYSEIDFSIRNKKIRLSN
jgi:hypothetical protein